MVRKSGKLDGTGERRESDKKVETKGQLEDDVDVALPSTNSFRVKQYY